MRVFSINIALFVDPAWWGNRVLGAKQWRYWVNGRKLTGGKINGGFGVQVTKFEVRVTWRVANG